MATDVTELVSSLTREINVPGFELFPDIGAGDLIGYVQDGFWEARLSGMLDDWTIVDGSELETPTTGTYITDSDEADFPEYYQMLVVIVAGLKILRLKAIDLAMNFRAVAGPVEYERQGSATVLRAALAALEGRLAEVKAAYSTNVAGSSGFVYFDAVMQREASIIYDYTSYQVY